MNNNALTYVSTLPVRSFDRVAADGSVPYCVTLCSVLSPLSPSSATTKVFGLIEPPGGHATVDSSAQAVLSKNCFVTLRDLYFTGDAEQTISTFFDVTIYVGTGVNDPDVKEVLWFCKYVFDKDAGAYNYLLPDFEKIFVPAGENVFMKITISQGANASVIFHSSSIVDDE